MGFPYFRLSDFAFGTTVSMCEIIDEMVKIATDSALISTMAGAFVGASFAFLLGMWLEAKRKKERQCSALYQAQASLLLQREALTLIGKYFIEHRLPKCLEGFPQTKIPPYFYYPKNGLTPSVEDIGFIVEAKGEGLFISLNLAHRQYLNVFENLDRLNARIVELGGNTWDKIRDPELWRLVEGAMGGHELALKGTKDEFYKLKKFIEDNYRKCFGFEKRHGLRFTKNENPAK